MKEKKKIKDLSEQEWNELASLLSGENNGKADLPEPLADDDIYRTEKQWKDLRNMNGEKINVDKAWNNVYSRIKENDPQAVETYGRVRFLRSSFVRVAAVALLVLGFGTLLLFLSRPGYFRNRLTFESGENQINLRVDLPDGSIIHLNRNSQLVYRADFGEKARQVKLTGEAFFKIAADAEKPFVIDAGRATVTVVGTSFSVLARDSSPEVEVFVRTGTVVVSGKSGDQALTIDQGYIGKLGPDVSEKSVNTDPNYLAWNTGKLVYKGEKLEVVLSDLKKYYNMDIVADDPSILENPWHTTIDYESRDKVIPLICASFNLSYKIDGDVYHLVKK